MTLVTLASISPFDAASPQAESIAHLFYVTIAILSVILVIVCGLTACIVVKFKGKPGDPDPPQVHGNMRLEITWTAIPLAIVTLLLLLSINGMAVSSPASAPVGPPFGVIVGHQWWWEIRYPGQQVVTANEVHVPVGQPLLFRLEAADVIHDFWVPQLGPKQDAVPGHPNHLYLQANGAGTYDGACAEFCGDAHAWMRIRVVAEAQADFDRWVTTISSPMPPTSNPAAARGREYFRNLACVNCHAISGLSNATAGPDLTWLRERQTLGAGVLENSPENLARWLHDPQAIKPMCRMPDFNLTDEELGMLVAFLWGFK